MSVAKPTSKFNPFMGNSFTHFIDASDETLKYMLKQAKHAPRLTASQELELCQRIANGDSEAESQLIMSNLLLVVDIANKQIHDGLHLELIDLIQEGVFGLCKAARNFDASRGRFSTYASYKILAAIQQAIESYGYTIHYSREKMDLYKKVNQAKKQFLEENEIEATLYDLSEMLDMDVSDIIEILACDPNCDRMDENHDYGMSNDSADGPLLKRESTESVWRVLNSALQTRDAQIFYDHEGLGDEEPVEIKELARKYDRSKVRIGQILNNAPSHIKAHLHLLSA